MKEKGQAVLPATILILILLFFVAIVISGFGIIFSFGLYAVGGFFVGLVLNLISGKVRSGLKKNPLKK